MATYSLNPGAQMFIPNYLLPPPYHHHIPYTPRSPYYYPPLPLPYYKTYSAPPPTAITTCSFPSAIPVFSTSTATCAPPKFPDYYKSSLGPGWFESVNQYPSSSQPFSHTSRFQMSTDHHSYGSTSVAAEEKDKNIVLEEKLENPHQANDFLVKAKKKKNIPPRLGGSHQHQHHHRQSYFRSNQKRLMIWKPKSAVSGETGRISTVDHDKIMKMLLPSKKTVEETSDANDQIDNNTTLMIRNIPSKYTRQMLTNLLEDHCKEANEMRATDQSEELSAFDFLYLPIDFERGFNRGYAFVNMTNSTGAKRLRLFLNNYKWGVFQSKKICQVTDAKYQGKEALVTHFLSSYFECESDELLPRCFSPYRDGSGGLVEESTVGRFCGQRHPSK